MRNGLNKFMNYMLSRMIALSDDGFFQLLTRSDCADGGGWWSGGAQCSSHEHEGESQTGETGEGEPRQADGERAIEHAGGGGSSGRGLRCCCDGGFAE